MKLSEKEIKQRKEELCNQYGNIKNIVSKFDVPIETQSDVVQEIFIYAYQSIETIRDMGCLKSWLFKITIRAVVRARIDHNTFRNVEIPYLPEQWETLEVRNEEDKKVWNILEKTVTDEDLREMVKKLKPPAPEIIKLRFVNGMTLKEIAEMMDINYNTVKTIESRGFMKIKEMIMGKGKDDDENKKAR